MSEVQILHHPPFQPPLKSSEPLQTRAFGRSGVADLVATGHRHGGQVQKPGGLAAGAMRLRHKRDNALTQCHGMTCDWDVACPSQTPISCLQTDRNSRLNHFGCSESQGAQPASSRVFPPRSDRGKRQLRDARSRLSVRAQPRGRWEWDPQLQPPWCRPRLHETVVRGPRLSVSVPAQRCRRRR